MSSSPELAVADSALEASRQDASTEPVISVRGISKCYEIYDKPIDRLKQTLWRGKRRYYREFWALRDISFEVRRGESIGIIGRNGSGKSTLLQIIAGTLRPTHGEVEVHGRVAALLELGSGFNPDFTGRENAFLNGAILGMTKPEVERRFDAIAAFADIGQFIDMPVKTYSTGMLVRLAFAVQIQLEPDILIVDEALAVGDSLFQKRCYQKLEEMRAKGLTLVFVSHDQESVRTLTTRALLLDEGHARALGSSAEVVLEYRRLLHEAEKSYSESVVKAMSRGSQTVPAPTASTSSGTSQRSAAFSFGDLDAEVIACKVLNEEREPTSVFNPGDLVVIRIAVLLNRDMNHLNVGFRLRSKEGVKIYSWGTFNQDVEIWESGHEGTVFWDKAFAKGEIVTVDFEFVCRLGQNFYEVQALVAEEQRRFFGAQRMLHWRDEAAFFHVQVLTDRHFFGGVCDLCARAQISSVQSPDTGVVK